MGKARGEKQRDEQADAAKYGDRFKNFDFWRFCGHQI
jgi:hypothetical protein